MKTHPAVVAALGAGILWGCEGSDAPEGPPPPPAAPGTTAPAAPASASTAPAASAPAPVSVAPPTGDWMAESVRYFRGSGFFADLTGKSDVDALADVRRRLGATVVDPKDPLADQRLLFADTARVWWRGIDAEPMPKNRTYERTLREWTAISRGALAPADVKETWDYDEEDEGGIRKLKVERIDVSFTHQGQKHSLRPRYLADRLDVDALLKLNDVIAASGYRFEPVASSDDTAFVVALTAEEKSRLVRERGWRFTK